MPSRTKKLSGKAAIVTGASKGIGASVARHLADEGAAVVVNYASSREDADRVVSKIAAKGGKAVEVRADISPVVVFLASPDYGWITGETIYASGGFH